MMKINSNSKTRHGLRTPLTSIKWFSELLESPKTGDLNDKQKEYLNEIKKATEEAIEMTKK
jgi:signal transduction histidine kinase